MTEDLFDICRMAILNSYLMGVGIAVDSYRAAGHAAGLFKHWNDSDMFAVGCLWAVAD